MQDDERSRMRAAARYMAGKAFYSYTAEPEGSYSIAEETAAVLRRAMDHHLREDRAVTHRFLMEYLIFRLFLIRYILKDYAQKYDGLIPIFRELLRIEGNLLNLAEAESGGKDGLYAPLPGDWKIYMLSTIARTYDRYEKIARKNEQHEKDPARAFQCTVRDILGTIREKTGIGMYPDLFHLFMEESWGYAAFLHESLRRMLPEEITIQSQPWLQNDLPRESAGACATEYRDLAYLTFALAGIVVIILAKFGR